VLATVSLWAADPYIPGQPTTKDFDSYGRDFIEFHCFDCHGDGLSRGDLSLEDLGAVDETNADLWKSIWAQVAIQEMPPKKSDQPEVLERIEFTDWITAELEKVMADKGGFHDQKEPSKGNFLAHELLFKDLPEEIQLVPTSSPKRIWRLSPNEHITRLNELINTEPAYDPERPGLRTHGDTVARNHGGELKLYFGVDRIINWSGGTVAYATAVKAVPVVLSPSRDHGLKNYAHFDSVNSAEATQLLAKANDILKYMAYGPESLIKYKEQITDDPASYWAAVPRSDDRGLPSAITYSTKMTRPVNPLYELLKEETPTYSDRDALFRPELAKDSKADEHGRVMLQDRELGLALNHALSYIKPDETLEQAIENGKMRTREDVRREVTRILSDESIRKPRVLQFFRDYFDYDLAAKICKDEKSLRETGVTGNPAIFRKHMRMAIASTDRLVELVLAEDKNVLNELLTTQKLISSPGEAAYLSKSINDYDSAISRRERRIEERLEGNQGEAANLEAAAQKGVLEGEEELKTPEPKVVTKVPPVKPEDPKEGLKRIFANRSLPMEERIEAYRTFVKMTTNFMHKDERVVIRGRKKGALEIPDLGAEQIYVRTGYMSFGKASLEPYRVVGTAPEGQRLGILTQPSWLISHSDAMDNHAIHRGIWIRKKLLGGGIPDVPITVDAQLPDEPKTTLRSRMRVTKEKYCWSCHDKMDPLGLTFEMYNHAGIYRTHELGEPVDTSGEIIDSGVPELNGPVKDAHELINRLASSEHVEQVFVRHAFRFWMGRNETIHDRQVLQDAHKAYKGSGGSMNALITSLVTSDAFLYRK